jgi:hypothetical protein
LRAFFGWAETAFATSEKTLQISDRIMQQDSLRKRIDERIAKSGGVWTPADFLDLGSREAVDKTLQRMANAGSLRRIDRGLYDRPSLNILTGKPGTPDYRQVVDAIGRRDQARMLVDGMTAANDLGLTNAVPGKVILHSELRRKTIHLDKLLIEFKQTAPSKLHWAGRPAMRLVQALHWLRDMFPTEQEPIRRKVARILADPKHGPAIRQDLVKGLSTLPAWMQRELRDLLIDDDGGGGRTEVSEVPDGGDADGRRGTNMRGSSTSRRTGAEAP